MVVIGRYPFGPGCLSKESLEFIRINLPSCVMEACVWLILQNKPRPSLY
jgi:hypothetical protein